MLTHKILQVLYNPVMTMTMQKKLLLASLLSLGLLSASSHAAKFKKWVDENGVVQYGTSIPPRYINDGHSELNERGIEVDRSGRAKTAEERAREKELAALRAEQQRIKEKQKAKDRVLLNMFRTEDDLIMVRDGKSAQIDAQIKHRKKQIVRLKERLIKWQAVAAEAERSGKKLNENQQENLDSTAKQIESTYANILEKETEQQKIIEHYNRDLEHFRMLKKTPQSDFSEDSSKPKKYQATLVETVILCEDDLACEEVWRRATYYAKKHATTRVQVSGDNILVTAPAREKDDISITVSHITKGGSRIFLDLLCHDSISGREICNSSRVKTIRSNFRTEVGTDSIEPFDN